MIVTNLNKEFIKVKTLIYGPSGIGKTTLAQTLVDHDYKPLLLSCDKGTITLLKWVQEGGMIDIVNIESWKMLHDTIKEIVELLSNDEFNYDVLFIDGLTSVNQELVNMYMTQKRRNYLTQQEWGDLQKRFARFIQYTRDLPMHVIFTCLESREIVDSKVIEVSPDVTGKMRTRLPGELDEVFYMYAKGRERYLLTDASTLDGTGVINAKDRSKMLKLNEEPDLGAVFDKILNKEL
jgi:hypothetical protein